MAGKGGYMTKAEKQVLRCTHPNCTTNGMCWRIQVSIIEFEETEETFMCGALNCPVPDKDARAWCPCANCDQKTACAKSCQKFETFIKIIHILKENQYYKCVTCSKNVEIVTKITQPDKDMILRMVPECSLKASKNTRLCELNMRPQ